MLFWGIHVAMKAFLRFAGLVCRSFCPKTWLCRCEEGNHNSNSRVLYINVIYWLNNSLVISNIYLGRYSLVILCCCCCWFGKVFCWIWNNWGYRTESYTPDNCIACYGATNKSWWRRYTKWEGTLRFLQTLSQRTTMSLWSWQEASIQAKVLRSIRKLEPSNVILGQYKASSEDKVHTYSDTLTPTFFAAALFIDNARWDGVPFLIKAGMGLIKHRWDWDLFWSCHCITCGILGWFQLHDCSFISFQCMT